MSGLVIVDVEQGSPEWHALRKSKRPASLTPALMGTSKFADAGDVYDYITGAVKEEDDFLQKILGYGNRMEPRARAALEMHLGIEGSPCVGYVHDYLASLDFISEDGGLHAEIKVPYTEAKSKTYKAALKGEIEPGYADQIEHQRAVFGTSESGLWVYVSPKDSVWVPYAPRPNRWGEIERAWDRFFEEHILKGIRPQQYVQRTDDEWLKAAKALSTVKRQMAVYAEMEEELKAELKKLAGSVKSEGGGVRVNVFPKKGSVDYKAAATKLAPADYDFEQHRKEGTMETRIDITEEKE